jgi:hypothetical protein
MSRLVERTKLRLFPYSGGAMMIDKEVRSVSIPF